MRALLLLLLLLVLLAVPVSARAETHGSQTLTFEKVIDGATIVASGRTIGLWGVKALDPSDPNSFAASLYLAAMLKKGPLRCDPVGSADDRQIMHCYSDGADIGSLMVQMGQQTLITPARRATRRRSTGASGAREARLCRTGLLALTG